MGLPIPVLRPPLKSCLPWARSYLSELQGSCETSSEIMAVRGHFVLPSPRGVLFLDSVVTVLILRAQRLLGILTILTQCALMYTVWLGSVGCGG